MGAHGLSTSEYRQRVINDLMVLEAVFARKSNGDIKADLSGIISENAPFVAASPPGRA
jgi:hypothetical protein